MFCATPGFDRLKDDGSLDHVSRLIAPLSEALRRSRSTPGMSLFRLGEIFFEAIDEEVGHALDLAFAIHAAQDSVAGG